MKLIRAAAVGPVLVVLCSCATTYPRYEPSSRQTAPSRISRATCKKDGGEIVRVCMSQLTTCITPYEDAGEPCRDTSECAGLCLSDIDLWPDRGTPTDGQCQVNNDPCGCFVEVSNDQVKDAWCQD